MHMLLLSAILANAGSIPTSSILTPEQAALMAMAPIDMAPAIATLEISKAECMARWYDFYECRASGYPDCLEPDCALEQ